MMRFAATISVLMMASTFQGEAEETSALIAESSQGLEIPRGDERLSLQIEDAEELVYLVEVDIGPIKGVSAGEARFVSSIETLDGGKAGSLEAVFKASHLGYELDHKLHSRHITGEEPALESSDTQRGSESRRRALRIGLRDGEWRSEYSYDGHCSGCEDKAHFVKSRLPWDKPAHCKKCKRGKHRVWREMRSRAVPEHTLDFLSVLYLLRSLVVSKETQIQEPLIEKDHLWSLNMEMSTRKSLVVPLGEFACSRVLLDASKPESEPEGAKFGGLFGMQGSLQLWVHDETGVLVQIEGELPLGLVHLGVKIRLKEAKGAPAGFAPIAR